MPKVPMISLNMPMSPGRNPIHETSTAFWGAANSGKIMVHRNTARCSLLTHTFNLLWANAINERVNGITHFAMIHDDVVPMQYDWLDRLYNIMQRTDADLVSVVIPIRSDDGKTSTALETDDVWTCKHLTLEECYSFKPTFSGYGDNLDPIVVNTGCFLLRMDRIIEASAKQQRPIPFFRQTDSLVYEGGKWTAKTIPEDWDFTRQVRSLGGRIFATTEVKVYHGEKRWSNKEPEEKK